jgi:hypothetical protein
MANTADRVVSHSRPDVQSGRSAPLARWPAWLVLVVMAAALVYTGWIALANFNRIGV